MRSFSEDSLRTSVSLAVEHLAPHVPAYSLRSRLYGAIFLKWLRLHGSREAVYLPALQTGDVGFWEKAWELNLHELLRELYQANIHKELLAKAFSLDEQTISAPPLVRFLKELSHFELSPDTDLALVLQDMDEILAKHMPDHGGGRDTSQPVTRLLTKLLDLQADMEVCDPVCGAGNLLLECTQYLVAQGGAVAALKLAGQEENPQNWATCKIKLLLLGDTRARIAQGDVLRSPELTQEGRLMRFDRVIADIPFGKPNWGRDECNPDPWNRFSYGLPSPSRGDFAFLQHMLAILNQNGKLVTLLPTGAMSREGREADIRAGLLTKDVIEAVISVPSEMLGDKSINAVILIANQMKDKKRSGQVLMIEPMATQEGSENARIDWIANAVLHFHGPADQVKAVPVDEIRAHACDLSPSLYLQHGRNERSRVIDDMLAELANLEEQRAQAAAKMYEILRQHRA